MTNFALVNFDDHQDLRVITERSARYGDAVSYALTFPFEFRSVQACYPILLHQDDGGELLPVALFGFEQGENLFLDDSGWDAAYVPAMIRREPFLIGYQGSEIQKDEEKARVLSIDMDHPRVNKEDGEPLFLPLGGRSDYLEYTASLLEQIYEGLLHSKDFVAALKEHDLIEAATFNITLADGSENQLLGFHVLDEDKVRELSGDVLDSFNKQGFLMPMFMMLASVSNIRGLIDRKTRKEFAAK
ncbi:MAG: multidrug transporter [Woeseiaceae bacterium]|nr:multidrug transporter [Woeseiaceae bacterium]